MKKVLYISNVAAPYRVAFLNELAKHCDLTVLYERKYTERRAGSWIEREPIRFRTIYLNGIYIKSENSFSLKILYYLFGKYDEIIFGCYNSPVQMFAIFVLRLLQKSYCVSTDGALFIAETGLKSKLKKFVLKGAKHYFTAGKHDADDLKHKLCISCITPYYFSSLTEQEVAMHIAYAQKAQRDKTVLVVGQYFDRKGLDIAVCAAKMDETIPYKFVGMGKRTALFAEEQSLQNVPNIELVPFLSKEALEKEYCNCAMMVLPSRQERWGLVVNEAASFGTPIVSTWGNGAAVEFLSEQYAQYLAKPGDAQDLYHKIACLLQAKNNVSYSDYLMQKSKQYTIEQMVQWHKEALCL